MDGLFFALSIVGVGLVMWWVVQNDRVRPDKPTTGLFAMPALGRVRVKKPRWTAARGSAQPERAAARSPAPKPPQKPTPWPRS
jgi:hypothetical protein